MPIVKIDILKGKSAEYKKELLNCVHYALVDIIGIPDANRMQRLTEFENECFEVRPEMSDKSTFIEITMFKGRTVEAKRKLHKEIEDKLLQQLEIEKKDIRIIIHEPSDENWSISRPMIKT